MTTKATTRSPRRATRASSSATPIPDEKPTATTPKKLRRAPKRRYSGTSGHWEGDVFIRGLTAYEEARLHEGDSPAEVLRRAKAKAKREHWELALLQQLRAAHLPEPERQYAFHPTHRYRADLCYPDPRERLIIEVDGGSWLPKGGHTTGAGFERDRVRDCEAISLGWVVLRVTPAMVARGDALRYIEATLRTIWRRNGANNGTSNGKGAA